MRILLLTDSHGQGMKEAILRIEPTWDLKVISHGAVSSTVWARYLERKAEVVQFQPEGAVVHLGHNDLQYHPVYNLEPQSKIVVLPTVE